MHARLKGRGAVAICGGRRRDERATADACAMSSRRLSHPVNGASRRP